MTEFELLDLMNGTIDSMGNCLTIYLSIFSVYLVLAYLAGDKLRDFNGLRYFRLSIFHAECHAPQERMTLFAYFKTFRL